jgi:hypothetical protein
MSADSRHSLLLVVAQLLPRTEVVVQFRYRPRRREHKLSTSFYVVPANVYITVTVNSFIFGHQFSSKEPVSESTYATKGADNFKREYQQLTKAISEQYPWAEQFLADCWETAQSNPDCLLSKSLERC